MAGGGGDTWKALFMKSSMSSAVSSWRTEGVWHRMGQPRPIRRGLGHGPTQVEAADRQDAGQTSAKTPLASWFTDKSMCRRRVRGGRPIAHRVADLACESCEDVVEVRKLLNIKRLCFVGCALAGAMQATFQFVLAAHKERNLQWPSI